MTRAIGIMAFVATAVFALSGAFADSAGAVTKAVPPSGYYDGTSTLISFTPAPAAGNPDPANGSKRPPSPVDGATPLVCSTRDVCQAYVPSLDGVTVTLGGDGHYRGHAPFQNGCPWDSADARVDVDIVIDGTTMVQRYSRKAGVYTDHCPGQPTADRWYISGSVWEFRGTLQGAPGTPAKTPTRSAGTPTSPSKAAVARVDALSTRQVASATAAQAGRRSSVPASLQSPSEAMKNSTHVLQNLLLAALLVLLLVFPSQLFNATFDKHHERIEDFWRKRFRRESAAVKRVRSSRSHAVAYIAVVLAGALLGGFLDPHFGFKTASIALFVGVVASILFGAALGGFTERSFRKVRNHVSSATLAAVPSGLAVALVCVVVSRAVHFQPGYLYGLVGGVSFAVALDGREAGRARFVGFAVGLGVAVAGWLLFVPVSRSANALHPNFMTLVADAFLAAVFIGGIEGALFSLVPLRFLPGHRVFGWSRVAWALLAFATAFLFVDVLLRPETGYLGQSSTASGFVAYGLFGLFGAGSVAFWGWFRTHPDAPTAPATAFAFSSPTIPEEQP